MTTASPVPRWLADLVRLLPIRAQFVLSGNVRDHFLVDVGGTAVQVPLLRALWEALQPLGFTFLVVFDPVQGIRVYPGEPRARDAACQLLQLPADAAPSPAGLETLAALARKLVGLRETRCALVIDFASRIVRSSGAPDAGEHRFFVACEELAVHAAPAAVSGLAAAPGSRGPLFNPVIWIANRERNLPPWFGLDTERVAMLDIGLPDYETREVAAALLAPLLADGASAAAQERAAFAAALADGTEGITLAGLADIVQLGAAQQLPLAAIDDAIRSYKLGMADNPWRKPYLRDKIRTAGPTIEQRVKGQRPATVKTIDILMRSVMGLTGAQARVATNRPRGVLFFAGPTGVGKTELAKALTELLFGDERACIRFDMSEFAAEHSAARLLGAPPGYVGYDAGGELTNAVRERPFSVILFDEIEKAHPRILDKFLQILEDGRLTDGRGRTAYFSETVIVFTSNLGTVVEDELGRRVPSVKPGEPFEEVEAKIRSAIAEHFKFRLARPELLNRIGENIVVFDFIERDVGATIFDAMLHNVLRRVTEEHGVRIALGGDVLRQLRELCIEDLSQGGRGIGNRLEAAFINPLARALFVQSPPPGGQLEVTALREEQRIWTLSLVVRRPDGGQAPLRPTPET
jgi:ATP-dependent Clp protease ATP-binding subunit ClpB